MEAPKPWIDHEWKRQGRGLNTVVAMYVCVYSIWTTVGASPTYSVYLPANMSIWTLASEQANQPHPKSERRVTQETSKAKTYKQIHCAMRFELRRYLPPTRPCLGTMLFNYSGPKFKSKLFFPEHRICGRLSSQLSNTAPLSSSLSIWR